MMCLAGQSQIFKDGEKLFEEMMGLSVSDKQIQRVSEHYGEEVEENERSCIERGEPVCSPCSGKENDVTYVMPDGSMVFTREHGWKEMKVGRIFSSSDCIPVQDNRHEIIHSQYICHLGKDRKSVV